MWGPLYVVVVHQVVEIIAYYEASEKYDRNKKLLDQLMLIRVVKHHKQKHKNNNFAWY